MTAPAVVFTDLDGTLLDHETYDWAPAAPLLARLRKAGVPVVLASSKTAAEIAGLRDAMGLTQCPAIVENGAGVLPAHRTRPDAARSHDRIRAALSDLPGDLRACFAGFSDWTPAEIAARTGLTPQDAARARARDFSEPGVFTGTDAQRAGFLDALGRAGIAATQGGRFLSLSFGASKADRMAEIVKDMGAPVTVALGDAPNDIAMLKAADYGVIVPNPGHVAMPELDRDMNHVRRAPCPGPTGWTRAVSGLLEELELLTA